MASVKYPYLSSFLNQGLYRFLECLVKVSGLSVNLQKKKKSNFFMKTKKKKRVFSSYGWSSSSSFFLRRQAASSKNSSTHRTKTKTMYMLIANWVGVVVVGSGVAGVHVGVGVAVGCGDAVGLQVCVGLGLTGMMFWMNSVTVSGVGMGVGIADNRVVNSIVIS